MTLKHIDVLVIGTEPPCPRCDLLAVLVERAAPPGCQIKVRHCAFDAPEAQALGLKVRRKIGTAKHVAKEAGIPVDWDAVYGLIEQKKRSLGPEARPADTWTPGLDKMLDSCRRAAESAGYVMTPILVVNGSIVHHGDVPGREQIAEWLAKA